MAVRCHENDGNAAQALGETLGTPRIACRKPDLGLLGQVTLASPAS